MVTPMVTPIKSQIIGAINGDTGNIGDLNDVVRWDKVNIILKDIMYNNKVFKNEPKMTKCVHIF